MISKNILKIKKEENIPELIGKPFNEPFEIIIINIKDKKILTHSFEKEIIEKLELNFFDNSSSAYCNGNNFLYISGGEKNNSEIINKLWKIDLTKKHIYDPISINPKKHHSMIFIPDNYIFIIGGNDTKTFYLNDEDSKKYDWADLNKERIEPALIKISNYLYCFDSTSYVNTEGFTLEKTDLNESEHKWELLKPKINLSLEYQKFLPKHFGLAKNSDNNIIFLGGNMTNKNENKNLINYIYNVNNNIIEASIIPFNDFNLKEKTFLKYNQNVDFILPDFNRDNPEIIFYIKKKNKIEKLIFKQNQNILTPMNNNNKNFEFPSLPDSLLLDNSQSQINYENKYKNNYRYNDINSLNNSNIKNNSSNNDSSKLKNKQRPNSYTNIFSRKMLDYNNEIVIPKFHYNVNDPGNELIIRKTNQNEIFNNYYPISPRQFDNSKKDKNSKNDNNKILKETPKKGKSNLCGIIPGIMKSKYNSYKKESNNKLNEDNYIISGTILGTKVERPKINLGLSNPEIKKNIQQINKIDFNTNIPDIDENKPEIGINISNNKIGNIQNININSPKIEIKSITNISQKDIKSNTPIINISNSDINNIAKDNYINLISEIKTPKNETTPKIEISNNNTNIVTNINKKTNNLKSVNLKKKEYNLTGIIPGLISGNSTKKNKKFKQNLFLNDNMLKENKKNTNKLRNSSYEVKGPRRIYPRNSLQKSNKNPYYYGIYPDMSSNPESKLEGNKYGTKIDFSNGNINPNTNKNKSINNIFQISGIIKGSKSNKKTNTKNNNQIKEPEIKINSEKPEINSKNELNSNIISPKNVISPIETSFKSPKSNKNNIYYSLNGIIEGTKINSPKTEKLELNVNTSGKINIENNFGNQQNTTNKPGLFLDGIIPSINANNQKLVIQKDNNIEQPNLEINEKKESNIIENNNINDNNDILNNLENKETGKFQQINFINIDNNDDEIIIDKNKLDKINYQNNKTNIIDSPNKLNLKEEEKNNLEKKSEIKSDLSNSKINNEIEKPKIMTEINFNNKIRNMLRPNYENNTKYIPQRGNSKKKNKGLPLVGTKNIKFEKSKTEAVGDFDAANIKFNNLRSTNVGVNGNKIGDRIIE